MAAKKPEPRRCAIYTRKSSEEGLEQDFNSLDAQREACEVYILSQVGEGWKLIKDRYDDGGFSGGNVKRPGLQQLLTDIAAGKVDIIVVYKVDRLTRSLPDFAKIVEVFDAQDVSFVSVTQQFNTTTSMGRLTLNMLLSFAQFEREVTGERIRDKIAASKKKGLWMGGLVPLGYEADGRTLKIVPEEAETVRTIFTLYRDLRSSWKVKQEADRLGLRTKLRTFKDGRTSGRMTFRYGHIHRIVHNPLYIGQIQHRGAVHEGQQPAIVDAELWEATRFGRSTESERRGVRKKKPIPYPLRGKLFDEMWVPLAANHATKAGRRYRYYSWLVHFLSEVSRRLELERDARDLTIKVSQQDLAALERALPPLSPKVHTQGHFWLEMIRQIAPVEDQQWSFSVLISSLADHYDDLWFIPVPTADLAD